jgi:CRP-like cAMP-binding protein
MSHALMERAPASAEVERQPLPTAEQRGAPGAAYDETPLGAADALARTPFFAGLSRVELARLVPELEDLGYAAGAVVFRQGDSPDGFYIIRRGEAHVLISDEGSGATVVARLGPGEYFGEMALVSAEPRSATVEAATSLEVWRLPSEPFRELLARQTNLPLEIAAGVSRRLAATDRELSRMHGAPDAAQHKREVSQAARANRGTSLAARASASTTTSRHALPSEHERSDARPDARTSRGVSHRASFASPAVWRIPWARAAIAAAVAAVLLAAWFGSPPLGMSAPVFRALILLAAALATSWLGLLPDFLAFLLMLALWAAADIVPARVAASGFASPTWLLLLATMAIGVGLARSGLL